MTNEVSFGVFGGRFPHVFPRVEVLREIPNVRFCGLWDPDENVREEFSRRYGWPTFERRDALVSEGVSLAIVEGLDGQNARVAGELAYTGLDLLIEKPGAADVEAMSTMVRRVGETDRHAQIGYMLAFTPAASVIADVLQSGALGHVTLVRLHVSSPVGCAAELWQSLPDDIGGVAYTDGSHMLDLAMRWFGLPVAVQGLVKRVAPGRVATSLYYKDDIFAGLEGKREFELGTLVHEDCATMTLEYDDKLVALDITGWDSGAWVEGWRVEIHGTAGTLYAGLMPSWVRVHWGAGDGVTNESEWVELYRGDEDAGSDPAGYSLVPDEAYRAEGAELITNLAAGRRSQRGLRRGFDVVRVLDAAFRSSHADGVKVYLT